MKRRICVAVLGLLVVVSSLASIPALAAGLDVEIAEIKAVDPASEPFEGEPHLGSRSLLWRTITLMGAPTCGTRRMAASSRRISTSCRGYGERSDVNA